MSHEPPDGPRESSLIGPSVIRRGQDVNGIENVHRGDLELVVDVPASLLSVPRRAPGFPELDQRARRKRHLVHRRVAGEEVCVPYVEHSRGGKLQHSLDMIGGSHVDVA